MGTMITDDAAFNLKSGAKSAIGATAVQLTGTSTRLTRGIQLKADAANTGAVYIGGSSGITGGSADATDGYPLAAGESLFIKIDDPSKVYLLAPSGSQRVFYLAL